MGTNLKFTKTFRFSASFARDGKVWGHNYVLGVSIDAPSSLEAEARFEEAVAASLIRKLESRDLGMDVDFLEGMEISDTHLLVRFSEILRKAVAPLVLRGLTLERDSRSVTSLENPVPHG